MKVVINLPLYEHEIQVLIPSLMREVEIREAEPVQNACNPEELADMKREANILDCLVRQIEILVERAKAPLTVTEYGKWRETNDL